MYTHIHAPKTLTLHHENVENILSIYNSGQ
jgi:hypothetical protein